jgi:hypothetical protein
MKNIKRPQLIETAFLEKPGTNLYYNVVFFQSNNE